MFTIIARKKKYIFFFRPAVAQCQYEDFRAFSQMYMSKFPGLNLIY